LSRLQRTALADALALLEATRAILATGSSFTKLAWARDRRGVPVAPFHELAERWCVGGALLRAGVELGSIDLKAAHGEPDWHASLNRLTEAVGGTLAWSLAAEFWNELSADERESLEQLLEELDGPLAIWRLTAFNDRSETRHEHVLAALDRTITNFKRAFQYQDGQDAEPSRRPRPS
jgi:hypothetical protein